MLVSTSKLAENRVILMFESCFPNVFDLADILIVTVLFWDFLNLGHFRPSSSPGSQHFFSWTRFSRSGQVLLNLFRQPEHLPDDEFCQFMVMCVTVFILHSLPLGLQLTPEKD